MAQKNDNPADPFKKALAEATKVMADDPELSVTYTVDPSGMSGESMRLPQVSRRMTREEVLWRAVLPMLWPCSANITTMPLMHAMPLRGI